MKKNKERKKGNNGEVKQRLEGNKEEGKERKKKK